MASPPELPQVYRASSGPGSNPWLFILGGAALVAFAIFGFALSLHAHTNPVQLQFTTTVPTLFAVALFTTAFRLAGAPREVVLDGRGIHGRSGKAERLLPWAAVAWTEVETQGFTGRRLLNVYDNDGKVTLRLPSALEPFDALVATLRQRLTAQPSPRTDAVRWRKSRRNAVFFLAVGLLALAGAAWTAWTSYTIRRAEEMLRTQAVDGQAVIVRKFVAPDGRTRRVEFRVAGAGHDAYLHNIEVDPKFWPLLREGMRVPIKTVSSHPEIARFPGEIRDEFLNPSPKTNLLLAAGLTLLGAFMTAGAVLAFKGIDIATDPATGKLRINRLPR
jgi:hypothetical protein